MGVYIKNELDYEIQNDLSLNFNGCEDIWLKINSLTSAAHKKNNSSDSLIIGVIYRHPTQNYTHFLNSLSKTLHTINERKLNYVIVGDINIDSLKYNIASKITEYVNCLQSYGCNMFIDKPTRVKSGQSSTCIDHVYSNLSVDKIISHIVYSDVSDHFPVLSKIDFAVNRKNNDPIYRRKTNLSKEDWFKFNSDLKQNLDREIPLVKNKNCPNCIAKQITTTYQKLIEKYTPLEKLSRKEKSFIDKPWITSEIRACIRKNNYLFNKSRRTNDPCHIEEHRVYRNHLSVLKKKTYNQYYKDKIAQCGEDKAS